MGQAVAVVCIPFCVFVGMMPKDGGEDPDGLSPKESRVVLEMRRQVLHEGRQARPSSRDPQLRRRV